MRWLQVAISVLAISGCVGTYDRVQLIEGELVGSDGSFLNGCWLEAKSSNADEPVKNSRTQVDGRFRAGLVNPPSKGTYFLTIDCGPSLAVYKSAGIDFSISKPVDLGKIVLKRK
jgi:hypothetical protein